MAENIAGMDFSYHDGLEWQDSWPELSPISPVAVRTRLIVAAQGQPQRPWQVSCIVNLPYLPALKEPSKP